MANITTSLVGDSIPTIVAAEALGYLKANTVLARLVNRDYSSEVATYGQTVTIPYGGALSVNDKSINTAVTLQTPNDAVYTLTLNKHKEVSFLIEDTAKAFSRPDWFTRYMQDGMMKLAEQVDSDIAALYSGFSQSIDATAGITEQTFRNTRRLLNSAKAPRPNATLSGQKMPTTRFWVSSGSSIATIPRLLAARPLIAWSGDLWVSICSWINRLRPAAAK